MHPWVIYFVTLVSVSSTLSLFYGVGTYETEVKRGVRTF